MAETFTAVDPSSVLTEGLEAENAKQLPRAEAILRSAVILPGVQEQATVSLGRVLRKEGKINEAIKILKGYTEDVNPFSVDSRIQLLDLYLTSEQLEAADAQATVIAKLRPGYEPFHERRAILAFRVGAYQKAIASLNQVLKADPNHIKALTLRYQSYAKLKEQSKAAEDLEHLIQLQPAFADHYQILAKLYSDTGDYHHASVIIKRGLTVATRTPEEATRMTIAAVTAYCEMADNLMQDKNPKMARDFLAEASLLKFQDTRLLGRLYFTVAKALDQLGDTEGSEKYYGEAFVTDPRLTESGLRFAQLAGNRGDLSTSIKALMRVISINPRNEAPAKELADAYRRARRQDLLGMFFQNYVEIDPSRLWAVTDYTRLLMDIGDFKRAEVMLEDACNDRRSSGDHYLLLVKVLEKQKKYSVIPDSLKVAVKRFPKDARLRFNLGLSYEITGQANLAEQAYKSVPRSKSAIYYQSRVNLAMLQKRNGHPDRALATLKKLKDRVGGTSDLETEIGELEAKLKTDSTRVPANEGSAR